MLFQKSIVSFVAAIALATSVSATSIAARGVAPTCPSGLSPYCCDSEPAFTGLSTDIQTQLTGAAPSLDQSKPIGQNCVAPPAQGCSAGETPLCCPILQTVDGVPFGINCQTPTNDGNDGNTNTNGSNDGKADNVNANGGKAGNGGNLPAF